MEPEQRINLISDWFSALRLENESLYSLSGFGDGGHGDTIKILRVESSS